VVFAARRTEKGAMLGFNKAQSHQIVPVETCVVATERINCGAPGAQTAWPQPSRPARRRSGSRVFDTPAGFDLAADAPFKLSETDRLRIIAVTRKERASRG
jgi:23S rRNA (uracil1939-C5)-methyltransferase